MKNRAKTAAKINVQQAHRSTSLGTFLVAIWHLTRIVLVPRKRAASDAVYQLCRKLDMPSTLREVGVPEEGLEFIASATLHDRALATHPKPVSDAGPLMSVWREAW